MPKPLAVVPDLEAELDGLYALTPAEFIDARNDLARRLKQAGQAEASGEVKALRKPTVPVWVVNQLARRQPGEMKALLAAAERLRAAQEKALTGEADELRDAAAEERSALRGLTQHATALLEAEGHGAGAATLERVASTLRAAATDPAGRDELAAGRIGEELAAGGFGALAGMKIPQAPPRRRTGKKTDREPTPAQRQATLRRLREKARKLEAEAKAAERAARSAEVAATGARRTAEKAVAAAERAREAVEQAEREA